MVNKKNLLLPIQRTVSLKMFFWKYDRKYIRILYQRPGQRETSYRIKPVEELSKLYTSKIQWH